LLQDVMMRRAAGVRRDVKKPSMVLAAMRGASGLCGIPLIEMRGWRAEKRKPMVSASVAGCGGRLSARQQALK